MDKVEGNDLLTAREVSVCLRIPLRTIYHLSKTGKVKAVKIGKQWRYRKEDIENYLSSGTDFSKEPARRPQEFAERRACPRINCGFKCHYSINIPQFKNINNSGIIKNISAGGILLILQTPGLNEIEIDDPVELDFELNPESRFRLNGRIVRKAVNSAGVKFRNLPMEVENRIKKYVG